MKKPSDELHQLIINLTLSEKRYCSIYLKNHAADKDNRYLVLFDYLKKQAVYDSSDAIRQLGFEQKPAHYSVLKKQLYEQLLDALHQFDIFSNPEQQLLRGIHQCQLLLQKGLFAQCEKRIATLTKTAAEMNHYEAQLLLLNLGMAMKARKYYRQVSETELREWSHNAHAVINEVTVAANYRYLSSQVYKMQYDTGSRGKELAAKMKNITELPEFSKKKSVTNLRALLDYYQVNALYCFANLEPLKAFGYNGQFLTTLDENPLMMQLHADRYFSVLNNYLIDCLLLKKYDMLENGLVKLRGLSSMPAFRRLVNFDANVFRLGHLLEMNYLVSTGKFQQGYGQIKDVEAGLHKHGERVVKHNRFTLQYLMAYVSFALNKFDEALMHLRPILQEKESAVAEDVQMAARMMQLLCHFEVGDKMLLDSLIKSIRRMQAKNTAHDMQRAVISFIHSSISRTKLEQAKWDELSKKITQLSRTKQAAESLNLFNYLVWVEAHTKHTSFEKAWEKLG